MGQEKEADWPYQEAKVGCCKLTCHEQVKDCDFLAVSLSDEGDEVEFLSLNWVDAAILYHQLRINFIHGDIEAEQGQFTLLDSVQGLKSSWEKIAPDGMGENGLPERMIFRGGPIQITLPYEHYKQVFEDMEKVVQEIGKDPKEYFALPQVAKNSRAK